MTPTPRCNFCGKTENEVFKLVSGPPGERICDECIEIMQTIIDDAREAKGKPSGP